MTEPTQQKETPAMKDQPSVLYPNASYTALDRILDRVLDVFDEFQDIDQMKDDPEGLDRALANLPVLKRRIAAALWQFGDRQRALILGFPPDADTQRATLELCAGDLPARFIATYTIGGETYQEERMALCLLQAEMEFHRLISQRFGCPVSEISVRGTEESQER
jgi:hypothetical protein